MNTPHQFQVFIPRLTALCRPGQKIEQEVLAGNCIIKLCQNRVLAQPAHAAQADFGRTLWEHRSEMGPSRVRLFLRRDHEYRILTQGKRQGVKKVTAPDGFPLPQIRLMVAALTQEYDDIERALWHLDNFRRWSESQSRDRNKTIETVRITIGLLPPEPDDLEEFDDISVFESWIGTWLVRLIKGGHAESLKAWTDAAKEVLENRAQLFAAPNFLRVQNAVESATLNGGGVACKAAVREAVHRNGGTILEKESFRSILKTLGFDWLPDQPEWKSKWLPIAEPKGWV